MKQLFKDHITQRLNETYGILVENSVDNLVIESGFPEYYFMDDQTTAFRPNPYFLFFCPDLGEGHILVLSQNQKPTLYYYIPDDIWHETSSLNDEFWEEFFDIKIISSHDQFWKELKPSKNTSIISPHSKTAVEKGLQPAASKLLSQLDWIRSSKTSYEIDCLKKANEKAALGHRAARKAFLDQKTELQILQDYLAASTQRETELPYSAIIGLDDKAAVLHYQKLRTSGSGKTFLIDAGARYNGYCSDITRTHYVDSVCSTFKDLHKEINNLQIKLCNMVIPNTDYIDIHRETLKGVTEIACNFGFIKTDINTALESKLGTFFFPHGVGHPLGLQVHDVAGKQLDKNGNQAVRSEEFPFLRTLRKIQDNDVLTIEPGFYFITKLLKSVPSDLKDLFNWNLIKDLIPFGGIRIEDNVVASTHGPINLTREFLPE